MRRPAPPEEVGRGLVKGCHKIIRPNHETIRAKPRRTVLVPSLIVLCSDRVRSEANKKQVRQLGVRVRVCKKHTGYNNVSSQVMMQQRCYVLKKKRS